MSIKVTVNKSEDGVIAINCSPYPPPESSAVFVHLPVTKYRASKRNLNEYRTLHRNIQQTEQAITFQEWADAISQAIVTKELNKRGATSEMKELSESAYLAMGDNIYKLQPVQISSQTKALQLAKKMLVERTKLQVEGIVKSAKESAKALLQSANNTRAEAKQILAAAQKEAGNPPPKWAMNNGYVMKWNSSNWCVQFTIEVSITHFDVEWEDYDTKKTMKYTWDAIPADPFQTKLWLPLTVDGSYSVTTVFTDDTQKYLPHISSGSSCMSIGDGPSTIKNQSDFSSLVRSISRVTKRVQMNSLLSGSSVWDPRIKKFLPVDLAKAIHDNADYGAQKLAKSLTPVIVDQKQEKKETFVVMENYVESN